MNFNKTNLILALIIVALGCTTTVVECKHMKREASNAMQLLSLTDTLRITKNRLGQETAHTGAIVTEYSAFKTFQVAKYDSLGKELKKAVNRRTLNATVATQELTIAADLPTSETLRGAAVLKTDSAGRQTLVSDTCRPVYTLRFDSADPYRRGTIVAGSDSFRVDLVFPEQLTFRTEESPFNLFRKGTYTSTYTNSNPYVDITGLKTYTVKCDCAAKSMISFGFGGLAGFAGGFVVGRVVK